MLFVFIISSCGSMIGTDAKQNVGIKANCSYLRTYVLQDGKIVKCYFDNLDTLTATEITQIAEYRRQQCDSIVKALRR